MQELLVEVQLEAEPLFQSVPVDGSIKLTDTVVPVLTANPLKVRDTVLTVIGSAASAVKDKLAKSSIALLTLAEVAPRDAADKVSLLLTVVMAFPDTATVGLKVMVLEVSAVFEP